MAREGHRRDALFDLTDTTGSDCRQALLSELSDYEDAVLVEAALREETSVKETPSGLSSSESRSVLPTARHWRDGIVDRLRVFDASGSSMQAFVLLVFSLKEEIASHDREEADAGR